MRRVLVAAIALVVALTCVAAARPAATFVIKGKGWGHGIGLAQYGAYGFAQHGRDYGWILDHYYPGTTLGTAGVGRVRVLLAGNAGSLSIGSGRAFTVRDANGRTFNLAAGAHVLGPNLRVRTANGQRRTLASPVRFSPGASAASTLGQPVSGTAAGALPGRAALRGQRHRPRAVREGRGRLGDAGGLAPGGAQGAGGRRQDVRPGEPQVGLVRPLRRHAEPGLRRCARRDGQHERRRQRDAPQGRPLARRACLDALPLDLRRQDRLARGRVGSVRDALPRQRGRSSRSHFTASHLGPRRVRGLPWSGPRLRLVGGRPETRAGRPRAGLDTGLQGCGAQRLQPRRADEAGAFRSADQRRRSSLEPRPALDLVLDRRPPAHRWRFDRQG